MNKIKDWFTGLFANNIIGNLIERWQTLHPASYFIVIALATVSITFSHEALEQHAILCETTEFCIQGIEYWLAIIGFYGGIVVAVLTGQMTFTEAKKAIKDKNKNNKK